MASLLHHGASFQEPNNPPRGGHAPVCVPDTAATACRFSPPVAKVSPLASKTAPFHMEESRGGAVPLVGSGVLPEKTIGVGGWVKSIDIFLQGTSGTSVHLDSLGSLDRVLSLVSQSAPFRGGVKWGSNPPFGGLYGPDTWWTGVRRHGGHI